VPLDVQTQTGQLLVTLLGNAAYKAQTMVGILDIKTILEPLVL
jgi:hypothetical protein